MKPVPTMQDLRIQRALTREQLEQWSGVIGNQMLSAFRKSNVANREAEDRAARRQFDQMSGGDSKDVDLEGDMGDNVVLGGIHHPPAVVYPPQKSSALPMIAAALLGAGIPIAGAAGYLYSQQQQPEFQDQNISIGLGKE